MDRLLRAIFKNWIRNGNLRVMTARGSLKHWRERFLTHREEAERLYDARFARMWEFYLAAAEMAFREQAMMVIQLQLTKRQDVVPMTRDYIGAETERLRARERRYRPPLQLEGE